MVKTGPSQMDPSVAVASPWSMEDTERVGYFTSSGNGYSMLELSFLHVIRPKETKKPTMVLSGFGSALSWQVGTEVHVFWRVGS